VSTKAPEGWVELERYIKGQPPENLQEAIEMEKTGDAKIIDSVIYLRKAQKGGKPMVMPEKKESRYAQRKRRKAELEALSDDELREEIEKASPEMRRKALKIAVSWLRGISSAWGV